MYRPGTRSLLRASTASTASPMQAPAVLAKHFGAAFDAEADAQATKAHCLPSWGSGEASPTLHLVRGDGCHVFDAQGKRYLDWNSQAMCANLGHSQPAIARAVGEQLDTLPHVWGDKAHHPLKARVASLLSDILPGDIDSFFFNCGGADANEAAMRMARLYTGRHKILARYRSYHGGTHATVGLTGDPRKQFAGPGSSGVVHVVDPYPWGFSWGETEEEVAERSLAYLREVVEMEGPSTIAAFFLESVTGTNGILKPPAGYLDGVRALCDEHGILMVCDEVMSGFGRTGKWFGFQHSEHCLPDIVTMAKGLTAAYFPLGAVGVRRHVADHFETHPIGTGSTYNAHPGGLAAALATLKIMLEQDVVGHVARMQPLMEDRMARLAARHAVIKQTRAIGLFGMVDLQAEDGSWLATVQGAPHPDVVRLGAKLMERGLFAAVHKSAVFCNPPLIATEEHLDEGFEKLDEALGEVFPQ